MKKFALLALLALSFATAPAFAEAPVTAATPSKANPQTEKMKMCAQEYHQKGIAKSEHRKFMAACLKKDYVMGSYVPGATVAKPAVSAPAVASAPATTEAAAAPVNQKDKMKQCNKDAKEKALKGQERKDFMKSCLSAH